VSHIVQIKTEVRDPEAVKAAAKRLGLDEPIFGTVRLFDGEATGLLVRLPDWLYHAVIDTGTGRVQYDNLLACPDPTIITNPRRVTPGSAASTIVPTRAPTRA
jgi:hypothetical protein